MRSYLGEQKKFHQELALYMIMKNSFGKFSFLNKNIFLFNLSILLPIK